MRKGFLIYEEMRKYLVINEEAVSHIWLWISLYMRKICFSFYQCICRRERRKTERKHLALAFYESSKSKDDITVWACLHLFILEDFLEPEPSTWICQLHFVGKINSAGCLYRGVNLPKVRAYIISSKFVEKSRRIFFNYFNFYFVVYMEYCRGLRGPSRKIE